MNKEQLGWRYDEGLLYAGHYLRHPWLLNCWGSHLLGLDHYRWYRRWQGGHWECWYNSVVFGDSWFVRGACSKWTGWRPGACHGGPTCESYPTSPARAAMRAPKPGVR